jgi:universal stress protein A
MSGYKQLLVALDFDEVQSSVLERAKDLASRYDAQLTLMHVVEFMGPTYAGDIPLPEDIEIDKMLAERAREQLQELAASTGLDKVDFRVELGVPKHEITRAAKELGSDLILIGSHGRHGIQLILGSTANGVLHLAGCDVLAVRCPRPA